MALRGSISALIHRVSESLRKILPEIYVRFAGIAVMINHKERALHKIESLFRGTTGESRFQAVHDIFRIKWWDIDLLSYCYHYTDMKIKDGRRVFSILGCNFERHTDSGLKDVYVRRFNWAMIALVITVVLFLSLHFSTFALPTFLGKIVPFWVMAMSELTVLDVLLSYRAFILVAQCNLVLCNIAVKSWLGEKALGWSEMFGPLFSYRVLLELLVVPSVLLGFYPLLFVAASTIMISILDLCAEREYFKGAVVSVKWPILSSFALTVLGFVYTDRVPSTKDQGRFHYLHVSTELFSVLRFSGGQEQSWPQKYRDVVAPITCVDWSSNEGENQGNFGL